MVVAYVLPLIVAAYSEASPILDPRVRSACFTRVAQAGIIRTDDLVRECSEDLSLEYPNEALEVIKMLGPEAKAALPRLRSRISPSAVAGSTTAYFNTAARRAIASVEADPEYTGNPKPADGGLKKQLRPSFQIVLPKRDCILGESIVASLRMRGNKVSGGPRREFFGTPIYSVFLDSGPAGRIPVNHLVRPFVMCRHTVYFPYEIGVGGCGSEMLIGAPRPIDPAKTQILVNEEFDVRTAGRYYIQATIGIGGERVTRRESSSPVSFTITQPGPSQSAAALADARDHWQEKDGASRLKLARRFALLNEYSAIPVLFDILDEGGAGDFEMFSVFDSFCDKPRLLDGLWAAMIAKRFNLKRPDYVARVLASAQTMSCGDSRNIGNAGIWGMVETRMRRILPFLRKVYASPTEPLLRALAREREILARPLFEEVVSAPGSAETPEGIEARIGLARLGDDRYLQEFISGLSSPDRNRRIACVKALGEIQDLRAVRHLMPLLDEKTVRDGMTYEGFPGVYEALDFILATPAHEIFDHPGVAYHPGVEWKKWWAAHHAAYDDL